MYNPVVAAGYRDKDSIPVPLNQHNKSYPLLEKQQSQNLRCGSHGCEGSYCGILIYEDVSRHGRFGETFRLLQGAGFVPQDGGTCFPRNFGNHLLSTWCDNPKGHAKFVRRFSIEMSSERKPKLLFYYMNF
jgi:hypothetical protein